MALSKDPLDIEKKQSLATVQSSGNEGESSEAYISWGEVQRIFHRRKKLIAVAAISITSAMTVQLIFQRLFDPVYQGSFSLLIKDPISDSSSSNNNASANTNFQNLALNSINNDLPTLIAVMRSSLVLSALAQDFNLGDQQLANRITITPAGGARRGSQGAGILNVKLNGKNPDNTKFLLGKLAEVYLETAQRQRQQRLRDGLAFLDQQAPALEEKSNKVLTELENFRKQNLLIDAMTEASTSEANLSSTEQSLLSLQNTRRNLAQVRKQVAAGNLNSSGFQGSINSGGASTSGTTGTSGSSLSGSIGITGIDPTLVEELTTVKEALAEARSSYQPSSFVVKSLEQKKAALEPLLLASQLRALDTALQVNADQINSTKLELKKLNQDFLRQPALMKGFEKLQSRLLLVQGNLAALTSAQESFRLELAQNSVPWRLLSPPLMNPIPIEPSLKNGFLRAILIGVFSGLGFGLLRDRMDHVFHNPDEIKADLKLPLLGHIPHVEFFKGVREDKRFLLSELDQSSNSNNTENESNNINDNAQSSYQRFFYQEAFRNLFTSIRFLNSDHPLKTVALTSSLPAEGKSLVNVLLSKTLSEMGLHILLIDADLRKPQMHTRLGLNNLSGLSNLLTEDADTQSWQDIVQNVPGYSGWSVITAGRRPPDPTRLLSSKRMHSLVNNISESGEFDLILFDTPPILGLADAALVAEHCDGLMLLVSLNRVDRSLPKEAVSRIHSSGAPLLGIISNGIKASKQSNVYGYGRYGYGKYGYGKYGYGNYGYGAYDPSATYAHYANSNNEDAVKQDSNQSKSWRKNLSSTIRSITRWIDS